MIYYLKEINFHFSNFIDIFLYWIQFQSIGITFERNFIINFSFKKMINQIYIKIVNKIIKCILFKLLFKKGDME